MKPTDNLTHLDPDGRPHMVDVSAKSATLREATAVGTILMQPETLARIQSDEIAKGNVLATAQIAAVQATKETPRLIPLCHSLPLEAVEVRWEVVDSESLRVWLTVRLSGKTGVEMEALTGASIALLTVYDMCKAIDRGMQMGPILLAEKKGGKSGHFIHPEAPTPPSAER